MRFSYYYLAKIPIGMALLKKKCDCKYCSQTDVKHCWARHWRTVDFNCLPLDPTSDELCKDATEIGFGVEFCPTTGKRHHQGFAHFSLYVSNHHIQQLYRNRGSTVQVDVRPAKFPKRSIAYCFKAAATGSYWLKHHNIWFDNMPDKMKIKSKLIDISPKSFGFDTPMQTDKK